MSAPSVTHSTFVIERIYPTTPDRVFAAFSDPAKKRRWFAGGEGAEVEDFQMDFRVEGTERRQSRAQKGPMAGVVFTNHTTYQDIVPDRRLVVAYTMAAGDHRISASLATFEFLPAAEGTRLVFTEQAAFFEGADGPQMREAGWRHLLDALAKQC
jgi:uncharacterized protein YndB with AHSA1/START domain